MANENEQVGHSLQVLNQTMRRYIDIFTHKLENDELLGTSPWILHFIAANSDHPVYVRDIEKHFNYTRSSSSKIIDMLARKGYVERFPGETDGRLRRLVLTPKAEAMLATIRQDHELFETELLRGFTANEIRTVQLFLGRMNMNLDIAIERQKMQKEGLS